MTNIEVPVDTREEDVERINRFSAAVAEVEVLKQMKEVEE